MLGSLVAPSEECTQSEGETLNRLLVAHLLNSSGMEAGATPTAACPAKRFDWQVAVRIVTYRRVGWATDSCASYKSPGMNGKFLVLLQKGREVLISYLFRIFRASLAKGYIPVIWFQVKVVFLPKPGRNS